MGLTFYRNITLDCSVGTMTIFFTSDHHFGHYNVIKYCNRPFTSAQQMDEIMILRWNETVLPDDEVYYLGDFAMHPSTVTKILPGVKRKEVFDYG